jgi:hypothetical protein
VEADALVLRVSATSRVPTFDVRTTIEPLKSVTSLLPRVSRPSSRIPKSALHTTGWAFSISSKRTTERWRVPPGGNARERAPDGSPAMPVCEARAWRWGRSIRRWLRSGSMSCPT